MLRCFHVIKLSFCCRFTWTKDDKPFDLSDPRVIVSNSSGTFRIPNEGHVAQFQGRYRCLASNRLGTAMSEEMEFIVPSESCGGRQSRGRARGPLPRAVGMRLVEV